MKYTIMGFSQEKLIEYNMDLTDVCILRYFVDFKDSGEMVKEIYKDEIYYWINYAKLREAIPIINISSNDVIRRRLRELQLKGILIHYTRNDFRGTYSFYNLGQNYKNLIHTQKNDNAHDSKVGEGTTQKSGGYDSKVGTKHSSIKHTSIKKHSSIKNITTTTEEDVVVVDELFIENFIKDFKEKYNCTLDYKHVKEMYAKKGKDVMSKYFNVFQTIIDSYITSGRDIASLGGLFKSCVIDEYTVPVSKLHIDKNRPWQSTNYEQREYDDEFYDSLCKFR